MGSSTFFRGRWPKATSRGLGACESCTTRMGSPPASSGSAWPSSPMKYGKRTHPPPAVEDPRITFIAGLSTYLMTYTAYGPLGPRIALAVSRDLTQWERLGPLSFAYEPSLKTDMKLYPNKDALFFSEPVPD